MTSQCGCRERNTGLRVRRANLGLGFNTQVVLRAAHCARCWELLEEWNTVPDFKPLATPWTTGTFKQKGQGGFGVGEHGGA